jgi:hypothetical protein
MNHSPRLPILGIAALALCLFSAPTASAILISPAGTSFGPLPAATFGGSGIPNDAVQQWTNGVLTFGLTATQRYANPPVTNDGAGTFFANTGGDILNGKPGYATWNFDYYMAGNTTGVTTMLYYDFNPAVGNSVLTAYPSSLIPSEESWNLGMGFLGGSGFDPNASGEYGFALVAYDGQGAEIGRSAILVVVGQVPEVGSTVLMLGGVLGVLTLLRRRLVA